MLKVISEITSKVQILMSSEILEFLQNVFIRNLTLILNVFNSEETLSG